MAELTPFASRPPGPRALLFQRGACMTCRRPLDPHRFRLGCDGARVVAVCRGCPVSLRNKAALEAAWAAEDQWRRVPEWVRRRTDPMASHWLHLARQPEEPGAVDLERFRFVAAPQQ